MYIRKPVPSFTNSNVPCLTSPTSEVDLLCNSSSRRYFLAQVSDVQWTRCGCPEKITLHRNPDTSYEADFSARFAVSLNISLSPTPLTLCRAKKWPLFSLVAWNSSNHRLQSNHLIRYRAGSLFLPKHFCLAQEYLQTPLIPFTGIQCSPKPSVFTGQELFNLRIKHLPHDAHSSPQRTASWHVFQSLRCSADGVVFPLKSGRKKDGDLTTM